jgi:pantothenate kinase type III
LWRQAHEAEAKAAKLRELGFDRYANSVAAANAFSDAAVFLEEKANK